MGPNDQKRQQKKKTSELNNAYSENATVQFALTFWARSQSQAFNRTQPLYQSITNAPTTIIHDI